MISDIDQILYPKLLPNLQEDISPVICIIWNGDSKSRDADKDEYDVIEIQSIYPFDTVDTIKRIVYENYKDSPNKSFYLPRFLFTGIPLGDNEYIEDIPDIDQKYHPIDYLWYPMGTNDLTQTYALNNPRKTLTVPDMRFVSSDGSYSSPNYELRGRSTIEQIFLKPRNGRIPVFHVYPLHYLLKAYNGRMPLSEADWNKHFAPYFPDVLAKGPYSATVEDTEYGKQIISYLLNRTSILDNIDVLLKNDQQMPNVKLSGVRQMMLIWKKPIQGFEGCASMFYQIAATEQRPYIRLLPAEGSAITKLHVKGVLPIPSLEDPRVIDVWSKEASLTPNIDFCKIKYIHRPAIGITQPIYGTINVLNDGTITLQLQPPKQMRKLDPINDFRKFNTYIGDAFKGLPQTFKDYELNEISVILSIKNSIDSTRFTKQRIVNRLPYFSIFFKEIKSVLDDNPIISLRYKALSQYASEDKIFTFITQIATEKLLDGEIPDDNIINAIQNEFQYTQSDAKKIFTEWFQKKGKFTVQLPEEGEFVESFHPGIDIHIYAQHPLYYLHINRIDSFETYQRVYTLLSLLFIDNDTLFVKRVPQDISKAEDKLQKYSEESELKYEHAHYNNNTNIQREYVYNNDDDELGIELESYNDETSMTAATAATAATASIIAPSMRIDEIVSNEDESSMIQSISATAPKVAKPPKIALQPKASVASVASVATSSRAVASSAESPVTSSEAININPNNWFINKLQEIDSRLFNYKVDSSQNVYSRKCAANDDRQPVVMTKDQFERMKLIYQNDPIFWIVYPLEGNDEPIVPIGTDKPILTVTVMRYGSDIDTIQYYFCPHYYCLYDELMITEEDFTSNQDRKGRPKQPNSCPFCSGKLISNRKHAETGYTVIKRKDKKGSTYHKYVDFMKKSTHPENFALPCCFIKQSSLRISDPEFSHLRDYMQQQELENVDNADNVGNVKSDQASDDKTESDDYDNLIYKGEDAIEYAVLFESMHKRYIIESNKHPTPGVFAIVSSKFDKYFKQNSTNSIITRVAIHLKLQSNAQGFLRIGTQNTVYESLLGVIAPLIYKNTIQEVKEIIKDVVTPRIFINTHFGNLVLEFYSPADGSAMPPTRQELMAWSQKNIGVSLNSNNLYPLIRIYNSYKRFIRFIDDPTQRKDLRHIQPLLAEPNLLTNNGIQLVVMEDNTDDDINIRCPIFGVSMDRHKKNDIVFISRSFEKIGMSDNKYAKYELFIHTSNKPAKGGQSAIHEHIIKWDYTSQRIWPNIVKERINEYMNQCQSRYRSLYTSQQGVNSMAMVPLSNAIEAASYRPEGIIKDNYNHIVAITFRSKPGSQLLVALPVIDDGIISITSVTAINNIYLDWNDFKPAAVEDVIKYYKTHLEPLFSLYPGYNIEHIVRQKLDSKIVAVQLKNGVYIPVAPPNNENAMKAYNLNIIEIEQFEWEIDKQIAGITVKQPGNEWSSILENTMIEKSCGTNSELMRDSTYIDFEEQYQQFRLILSNWITSHLAGSEIKKGIEDIIFNSKLPEYERRKRLYIYISSTLLSWFYEDKDHEWNKAGPVSFLRKDCRVIDSPQSCTGSCYWKQDDSSVNNGKCLLHVNDMTRLHSKDGNRNVNTAELFTKRAIDELVRFPNRRKQLMTKNKVSHLSQAIKPIRIGDQYIIPETSVAWTNLLRLDWAKQVAEEPKYYEEMSRLTTNINAANTKEITGEKLPDILNAIFENSEQYRLKIPQVNPNTPLLSFTSILGITLDELGVESTATKLNKTNIIRYVSTTSKPIGFIDLTEEEKSDQSDNMPTILFAKPMRGVFDSVLIFVFLPDATGLLVEEEGNITVKIASLPPLLQEKWSKAGLVQGKKKVIPSEESKKPTIIIGQKPIMAPTPHIPLIAQIPSGPISIPIPRKPKVVPAVSAIPAVSTAQTIPKSIPLPRKPKVQSTASVSSIVPTVSVASVVPKSIPIPRKQKIESIASTAPIASIAPTASTASTVPTASTAPKSIPLPRKPKVQSTASVSSMAPTESTVPTASTVSTASTESTVPTASTALIAPKSIPIPRIKKGGSFIRKVRAAYSL